MSYCIVSCRVVSCRIVLYYIKLLYRTSLTSTAKDEELFSPSTMAPSADDDAMDLEDL